MILLLKQRMFSWFDSYDIYDEAGNTVFVVKGELAWGHCMRIYDAIGNELGMIKQKILTFMPKFEIYINEQYVGSINREFNFFTPSYNIDYNGWYVEGNFWEWDYDIFDINDNLVATISKEFFNWTDTYSIEVFNQEDALSVLLFVLAVDAEKDSRND